MADSTAIKYVTLSASDRLATAKDFLSGRERDHYRLWLSSPEVDPSREARLPNMAEEIKRLQDEVAGLEKEAQG